MHTNRKAFLDMLAKAEGTYGRGDNGYNVLVGGTLFTGYADHPRVRVWLPRLGIYSTAAGRYQILQRYYDAYKAQLHLPDFSPASQDLIALKMIAECKAFDDIDAGRLAQAINKTRSRWASLPGAGYGQREQTLNRLIFAFTTAGGVLA